MKHEHGKIDVIPNNTENYTSFSINSIPFLDSNQFMQTSLSNLASNLNETHFSHVRKFLEQEEPQAQQHQTADDLPQLDASLLNLDDSIDQMIEDMQDFRFVYRPPSRNQSDDHRVNEDLQLLTRKGVYPYEYMDSFEKFKERHLPEKTAFASKLTLDDISDTDYEHAQQVSDYIANVCSIRGVI